MIPHGVGKCRGATKGTLSRQELATNEVSRLRDCLGSIEKGDSPRCGEMSRSDKGDGLPSGAGCEQREQTEGLFRLPCKGSCHRR